jgi:branched-chain amino acid transport system permease protein
VLNFFSLRGYFGTFDDAVFGSILILIMLFAPDGIIGSDLRALVKKLVRIPMILKKK